MNPIPPSTLTIDMKDRSMNVLSDALAAELAKLVDKVVADPAVKGAIITSGKTSFIAGADLRELELLAFGPLKNDPQKLLDHVSVMTKQFRKMETSGKPFVAAITGTALGGGLELCLSCHYRVAADNPKAQIGLPEVTIGLLPGAGGTQRLPRMIGMEAALPLLTQGTRLNVKDAMAKGLIDEIVPAADLTAAAKKWIIGGGAPNKA